MHILASTPIMSAYVPGVLLLVAASLVGVWLALRNRDVTTATTTPEIPPGLDPYEVAYLNGGVERVLRVVVMDLAERGYLRVSLERYSFGERLWVRRASAPPRAEHLAEMERRVFEDVPEKDAPLEDIVSNEHLRAHALKRCASIHDDVVDRGLMHAEQTRHQARALKGIFMILLLALTTFTLFSEPEHPGLVLGAFVLGLVTIFWGARIGRLTDLGRRYVGALHHTHQHLRKTASVHADIHAQYNTLVGAIYDPREALNPVHRAHVERADSA